MIRPQDRLTQPGGLADRLRNLRTAAGMAGKDLAEMLGWAPSKVSRLENGRQMPSTEDIAVWAQATRAGDEDAEDLRLLLNDAQTVHRDWRRRMSRGQVAVQKDYNDLVANSTRIRYFETTWIPGFLQIPDYARRAFAEMVDLHDLAVGDVEAAVTTRLERQQALYDTTKQFELMITEPVLGWMPIPPAVMRAQLDRLQTAIDLPNVRFGIVPLRRPLSRIPQNSFQLYDNYGVVETFVGETECGPEDVEKYHRVMDQLWEEAVTGSEARRLIVAASDALPR
ncbi:helix-turn-helix domain-containing protein [Planosporangium mesophilum]|uniref:Transcriptional regulator n=1 Tax=Planosporangium mesophilum TaxID=689768 RepID=A0A8J3TM16_9ACTN|nr:helix-turn-helix transcriptional regulator [Planosporangium mesophilum]GII23805.1 transcriptional regulator [Planosporangium mesophilum]